MPRRRRTKGAPKPLPKAVGARALQRAERRAALAAQAHDHLRGQNEQLVAENEHLREALQTLELTIDRFADHYDLAPFGYLTLDRTGAIREINQAACALLGIDRFLALGILLRTRLPVADRPVLARHLGTCRRRGVATSRLSVRRQDDSLVAVELISRLASSDRLEYFPTAIIESQQEREHEGELEREGLLEATRAALEHGAARTELLAMVSHELRTPLMPLLTAVGALEERVGEDPDARNFCQIIRRSVAAQGRLIEDLVDVTRINRGKMTLHMKPTQVHGLVTAALEAIQPSLQAKALRVTVALEAGRHLVDGDPMRLGQVFANLIGNAVKFTPAGGEITVRSWESADTVAVEVSDSGIGIAPASLPHLFRPFEQAHRPPGSEGGLGLGLTISKGIIELHNGRISAASGGPGQGARFVVELPALRPKRATNGAGKPLARLLVVEDDPDTAEALSLALGAKGYHVERASSIAGALRADLTAIDLVVSDLRLPDGDGRSFLQQLRARGPVTAIALSGYGTYKDVDSAKEAGFFAHLIKPVPLEVLMETIERALADKRRT
jgi:signal transduction histidine kinase